MKLGIRSRLFLVSLGLIAATVLVADFYLTGALDRQLTARIRDELHVRAKLVAQRVAASGDALDDLRAWDALADELGRDAQARVTVIRRDGVVLGDSEVQAAALGGVENHAARPEVAEALARGRGSSVRYSTTVRERMMYVAVPFDRGRAVAGTVRVAVPLAEVDRAILELRRTLAVAALIALIAAVALSMAAAAWTSRSLRDLTRVARQMAAGNLAARARSRGHDEIAELGQALNGLAEGLSRSLGELRAERDLLEGVLSGMREGVLVVGRDGRIVLVNPALREMLLPASDPVGKTVLEAVRNAALSELLERAAAGTAPPVEIELAGLKPRHLLAQAVALAGEPGGVLAVLVDVTELRRLESVRRDFVANASHELRTPVAAVCSAAETLRSAAGDPEASARFIDIIERNGRRLRSLVEDLLELSRIESREFRLALEPVDLSVVVAHILALYRGRAEQKRIALESEIGAGLPPARADRRALEQVLGNLVDNALKYCPEGARVLVRAAAEESLIRVAVEDTGPGIEPKHLPRLFERFYRVDPGRSRELGGTGLGLAIVKHLVEAMHGTVGVESTVGRGTAFTFVLPRA
ncbi:MAG TPA: ATP-binding protein [Burkholderiales bacterium]|nr:ATP-binding protein [Burkholderiales bacterium]